MNAANAAYVAETAISPPRTVVCGESDFVLPSTVRDGRLRLFWEYWRGKRADLRRIPGRQHIDPAGMIRFLANIVLFDVERISGSLFFRIRLMGTDVVELFGGDATGRYLHETAQSPIYAVNFQRLSSIVETHLPAYGIQPVPRENRTFLEYEHLTVPLASDGRNVDMLFGIRCGKPAPK